jgi:WD40 repeat protein
MDTYGDEIKRNYISFSEESTEIILSGFTDRKIIIISIYLNLTEDSLETESQILYSKYFSSPITATCIFNYCNINYLLLGDQNGNLFLLKKQSQFKYILLKIINDHTQEIQYITFNSHINCFATTSKDGFVNFYLVPSFTLLNSFEVTKDSPIDKVFIFHTPLYCFVAFNEQNKSLICHSINIDQVLFEYEPDEEMNLIIKCPVIIEKRNANEYLAFVNEKNEIIVLTIPELNEFKKCSVDFEVCILEYSKESNVLIAVEKGGCSIAYVNIWD